MDSGEEIQGLGEGWTFLGAKISEWSAGITVFVLVGEIFFKGQINIGVPVMMICGVTTALLMVRLRKTFPDEERGIINHFCTMFGIKPPGIPTPAALQEDWSGVPIAKLDSNSEFVKLGLHEIFFSSTNQEEE
jgi:hypothetical protein